MEKTRGFAICKGYEGKTSLPLHGSPESAGYDLFCPEDIYCLLRADCIGKNRNQSLYAAWRSIENLSKIVLWDQKGNGTGKYSRHYR